MAQHPDDIVQLLDAANEFQAGIIVETLAEAGITAKALTMMTGDANTSPSTGGRVPVMVRRDQVEAARAALEQRRSDSVDIDWNEVDIGESADGEWVGPNKARNLAVGVALVMVVLFIFWLFGFFQGGPPPMGP